MFYDGKANCDEQALPLIVCSKKMTFSVVFRNWLDYANL